MTSHDTAHALIVRTIVRGILLLALLLYAGALALLFLSRGVPGELWQAAAAAAGVLGGLLASLRSQQLPAVVDSADTVNVHTDETPPDAAVQ